METLLSVSLPFFALIFGGYAAGRFGALSEQAAGGLNSFVFWFALPTMLFMKMSEAPLAESFDWRFIVAYSGSGLIAFAVCIALARLLFASPLSHNAIQGMGAAFGNVGYIGLPLLVVLFGERAILPAVLVIVFDHLILFPLTTAMLEIGAGRHASLPSIFRRVALGLVRNPLIVATAAGLLWSISGFALPVPVAAFGNLLAAAAAPCALFALGATLVGRPLSEGLGEAGLMSACKLVLHPAVCFVLAAYVLELDPFLTGAAVIEASLPIAANVFIMARAYDVYAVRASSAILLSTIMAVVTVSAVLATFAPG